MSATNRKSKPPVYGKNKARKREKTEIERDDIGNKLVYAKPIQLISQVYNMFFTAFSMSMHFSNFLTPFYIEFNIFPFP